MARLIAVLAGVVAMFLGIAAPASATSIPDHGSATSYTYNDPHRSLDGSDAQTERGPPSAVERDTTSSAADRWSTGASARSDDEASLGATTTYDDPAISVHAARAKGTTGEQVRRSDGSSAPVARCDVAAKSVDEFAAVGFRSDASHIFRSKAGHFAEDTAENRSLIQSAVNPANLRETVTLRDGASLSKYYMTRSDGTQLWAEVRNGEITNGGLNVIPR